MKRAPLLIPAALLLLPLATAGCGSSGSSGGGSPSVTCTNGTISADDANDYAFSSSLMLHPVKVKSMSDLTVDWGGVTKDFLGQPVNPSTDLNAIFLLSVGLPAATFEMQLNDDTFQSSSILIPGPPPSYIPQAGETSKSLVGNFVTGAGYVMQSDLDTYLDAGMYTPSNTTFAFGAQTGTTVGAGDSKIRMLQSFELDPSSSNTKVTMTNSSTTLTYTANLHQLHPTGVPSGAANLTLDWSTLQHNALGTALTSSNRINIDHAIVGHYTQSVSSLESDFLNLQGDADKLYQADIGSGTVVDFSMLQDASGNKFSGIDSSGTWLVALLCTTNCRNPAPWYLTILTPNPSTCQ
jgi:hypothetical protein